MLIHFNRIPVFSKYYLFDENFLETEWFTVTAWYQGAYLNFQGYPYNCYVLVEGPYGDHSTPHSVYTHIPISRRKWKWINWEGIVFPYVVFVETARQYYPLSDILYTYTVWIKISVRILNQAKMWASYSINGLLVDYENSMDVFHSFSLCWFV